ncbi:amidase [Niveibacterium sp. SC-1]|uniref:amidase n=1 Tax=Niveibacterium sp. SC-1 TaxID=3135646 RepID=UPI00311DD707
MSTHVYSWQEWATSSASDIADAVRNRHVSATEVVAQARAAAAALDPRLAAVVELLDGAAEPADLVLSDSRFASGALAGVPLFIKDLGSSIAGLRRENGSALHRDERVARTDPLLANWLNQGVQVLGRSTTAEFGMAYDTSAVYRGLTVTRNPWNTDYTAGGSSGGAAALVAAGVVPIAHATDGAGSIRIPAAMNGIVGLKISRGRLPLPWHVNELINTSMVEGVFARALEDLALALDAASTEAAPAGKNYVATDFPTAPTLAALKTELPRLRIGFSVDDFGRSTPLDPMIAAETRAVADRLTNAGHQVEEIRSADLPDFGAIWRAFEIFWAGMRAATWAETHGPLDEAKAAQLSPMVRAYWQASARYGKDEVVHYLASNVRHSRPFAQLLARYDVLLLPATPALTPLANTSLSPCVAHDFDAFLQRFLDFGRYTIPANETGLPALTLPAGLDRRGLPIGIQLYGRWRGEAALLRAGAAVQAVIGKGPLDTARPEIHVSRL